ncbi:hypothetical protein BCR44DRAFT_330959 [Catenaria anguillulae PL171]|uniref:Uncharacterized protein n=1 Tax=Catenaria anguillulae PL171 TaxID=765915 RepID=A0A1Y2HL14_9FUNG|nr:hypothetical protein BCR44DRAFT_330959 [Catenaria anguillulae PL171]
MGQGGNQHCMDIHWGRGQVDSGRQRGQRSDQSVCDDRGSASENWVGGGVRRVETRALEVVVSDTGNCMLPTWLQGQECVTQNTERQSDWDFVWQPSRLWECACWSGRKCGVAHSAIVGRKCRVGRIKEETECQSQARLCPVSSWRRRHNTAARSALMRIASEGRYGSVWSRKVHGRRGQAPSVSFSSCVGAVCMCLLDEGINGQYQVTEALRPRQNDREGSGWRGVDGAKHLTLQWCFCMLSSLNQRLIALLCVGGLASLFQVPERLRTGTRLSHLLLLSPSHPQWRWPIVPVRLRQRPSHSKTTICLDGCNTCSTLVRRCRMVAPPPWRSHHSPLIRVGECSDLAMCTQFLVPVTEEGSDTSKPTPVDANREPARVIGLSVT